jgi:hypothetical protein
MVRFHPPHVTPPTNQIIPRGATMETETLRRHSRHTARRMWCVAVATVAISALRFLL